MSGKLLAKFILFPSQATNHSPHPPLRLTRTGLLLLCPQSVLLPLGFTLIFRIVVGQTVQDEDLSPLSALVQGREQLVDVLRVQVQQIAVGMRLADLRQSCHGISYNLGKENRDVSLNTILKRSLKKKKKNL